MRDLDIRRALRAQLADTHPTTDTLIIDEFPVCNKECRVDVALVNGEISGYEIKSARDSLARLPGQRDAYNRVFDRVVLVAATRHLQEILKLVPAWWGVVEAKAGTEPVELVDVRIASPNPSRDPIALASLLRRTEAIRLLEHYSLGTRQLLRGSQRHMWVELASSIPVAELAGLVRTALKNRSHVASHDMRDVV